MKRFSRVLAMILCLTLLLTACGGTETSSSAASGSTATSGDSSAAAATTGVAVKKDPDQFTAAFETEPGKLDPQNNSSLVGIMIFRPGGLLGTKEFTFSALFKRRKKKGGEKE